MYFKKGDKLKDVTQGQTRWMIAGVYPDPTVIYMRLIDRHPDIAEPMERTAVGVCCNFYQQTVDRWGVIDWRRQFETACIAASGNFAGFPEPLDFFRIENNDRNVPEDLRRSEPVLVYTYSKHTAVDPIPAWKFKTAPQLTSGLRRFVYDLAYALKGIHERKLILRQVPLQGLRYLPAYRRHIIGEFLSMTHEGESQFNPGIQFLVLNRTYCAPECFDARGRLTPATDVYALAVTVLEYLGVSMQRVGDRIDVDVELSRLPEFKQKALPDPVRRFLKLALQTDPTRRPRDMGEVMGLISGRPARRPDRHRKHDKKPGPRKQHRRRERI